MLSDCLFGCCQCFWCSYFIRCIVQHFSSITRKTLFCFCWSSNFCKVSSSNTSSCNGIFLSFSCLHFYWVLWVIGSFPHLCQFDLCCNLINWQHILVIQESFCAFSIQYQGSVKDSKHFVLWSLCHCHVLAFLVFFSQSLWYKALVHLSLDVHKLSTTLRSLFLDMWFEILLTMNILWFKDDRRPLLPQKWLFLFWSLSITTPRSLADFDSRISWSPTLILFGKSFSFCLLLSIINTVFEGFATNPRKKDEASLTSFPFSFL